MMKNRPLEGIKVLDFSQVLAAPFCGMMLADMGAEVIKVERPGLGDISREYGPYKNDISLYFCQFNRGKKDYASKSCAFVRPYFASSGFPIIALPPCLNGPRL